MVYDMCIFKKIIYKVIFLLERRRCVYLGAKIAPVLPFKRVPTIIFKMLFIYPMATYIKKGNESESNIPLYWLQVGDFNLY